MKYQLPFTITSKILKVGNKVGNDLIENQTISDKKILDILTKIVAVISGCWKVEEIY